MGASMLGIAASPVNMMAGRLHEILEPVNSEMAQVETALAAQVEGFDARIADKVSYVLEASGKRLRPSLALLCGGATGGITDGHRELGVIVELVHIATLLHDDVLDEASLRHGQQTSNFRWGNEISVLLGDCLFAHSLALAAGFPTTEVCRRVSQATNTVCAGEILQTQHEFDLDLSLEDYLDIIRMKTGALFAVSCELGGILNDVPPAMVESLGDYGINLGIAYQIYDDCVDMLGQEQKAGKSLGTDMRKGKLTLPLLLHLQESDAASRELLGRLIVTNVPEDRGRVRDLVLGNGAVDRSLLTIESYVGQARAALANLPVNRHSLAMSQLLQFLSAQSRQLLAAA